MEIDVGRVIAGKFRLVRLIGRGSMGEVWEAHHETLNEQVALKLLMPSAPGEEEFESVAVAAARFRHEAQVAARLSRKTRHIARVTDHGEEEGLAYLVMELLEGETLENFLEREQRIPLAELANIVCQVGRALNQAHAGGVAHRDLKPANIFLSHDEDGKLLVKLLDFGIARSTHVHRAPAAFSTAKGVIFGTPGYMSPEQARASEKLDHRCDLWALATIAYEGVAGSLPIEGKDLDELLRNLCAGRIVPIRQRQPEAAERLDRFFARALAESVDDRFQSAGELTQAFARAVGAPLELVVSSPSLPDALELDEPASRPPSRSRGRTAAITAGAVLVACAALGVAWLALAPSTQVALPSAVVAPARVALPFATVVPSQATPQVSSDSAIPVSDLPHAPTRQVSAGSPSPKTLPQEPGTGSASPVPSIVATATPPAPTPAPAPVLAPAPTATTKADRSEVF